MDARQDDAGKAGEGAVSGDEDARWMRVRTPVCVHDSGYEHPSDGTLPCSTERLCDCDTTDTIHFAGCAYLEATSPATQAP